MSLFSSSIEFEEKDYGEKMLRMLVDEIDDEPYVKVGFMGTKQYIKRPGGGGTIVPPTIVDIAIFHEFGAVAQVTPAMRGWFKGQGRVLPETQETIVIPERSFMRSTAQEKKPTMEKLVENQFIRMITLKTDVKGALGVIGETFKAFIQAKMTNGPFKELSPWTIARKKSSSPLMDTGQLRGSVSYKRVLRGK